MSYDVGTYVDLSHINKRAASAVQKKTIRQQVFTAIKISEERYVFTSQTPRSIPVAFA